MSLSVKQQGVLRGMIGGAILSASLIACGILFNPVDAAPNQQLSSRLLVVGQCFLLLAICLAVSIGRLAKHRFFSPEDIDGGGLTPGSEDARVLQSLLQNTLEQCLLAGFVYLCWAMLMPSTWLSVIPLAAFAFAVGRLLFFAGYRNGAPARALGFTLTFYPSVGMLLCMLLRSLYPLDL